MNEKNDSSVPARTAGRAWVQPVLQTLKAFWPARQPVDAKERWRSLLGAGLGILFTALLCRTWSGASFSVVPWLVAPLGASAVLVFALPASPLAHPWAVIGGNTLSTLVGAACAMVIPEPAVAGAVAVAVAIGVMFWLRCLHPPGGAAALLSALGGLSFHFAVFPVLSNCVLLVVVHVELDSVMEGIELCLHGWHRCPGCEWLGRRPRRGMVRSPGDEQLAVYEGRISEVKPFLSLARTGLKLAQYNTKYLSSGRQSQEKVACDGLFKDSVSSILFCFVDLLVTCTMRVVTMVEVLLRDLCLISPANTSRSSVKRTCGRW